MIVGYFHRTLLLDIIDFIKYLQILELKLQFQYYHGELQLQDTWYSRLTLSN